MKSVSVQLSDFEFNRLGLNKDTLSFPELKEIIGKKITKQTLEKSIRLANKHGLSKITMEDINDEIKAHRSAILFFPTATLTYTPTQVVVEPYLKKAFWFLS